MIAPHETTNVKFRAWDKFNGRWCYYTPEDVAYGYVFSEDRKTNFYMRSIGWEYLTAESIYLGVKDETGKEIYDGDQIQDEVGNCWVARFNPHFFHMYVEYAPKLKVIGNIHQHVESDELMKHFKPTDPMHPHCRCDAYIHPDQTSKEATNPDQADEGINQTLEA